MTAGREKRATTAILFLSLAACTSSSNGSQSSGSCIDNTSTLSVDNDSKQDATIAVATQTFLAPAGQKTQVTVPAGEGQITAALVASGKVFQTEDFQFVCGALHHFSIEPHPDALVVVAVGGEGFGKAKSDPPGIDCSVDGSTDHCNAFFPFGTALTLTSIPDVGSQAVTPTQQFVLAGDQGIAAGFTRLATSIAITMSGNGSGSVYPIPYVLGDDCTSALGVCNEFFENGTDVTIVAEPSAGSTLNFTGDCAGTACKIHVDNTATANVGVTFTLEKETLTASILGSGSGDLVSSPEGLICNAVTPNACSGQFDYGTQIFIEPLPGAGSKLSVWGGACAGTEPGLSCVLSIVDATNVTADFEPE